MKSDSKLRMVDYMLPTLKILADGRRHSRKEIAQRLASEHREFQPEKHGGAFIVLNGILGYFMKAKLVEAVEPKSFEITNRGKDLLKREIDRLDVESLRQFPEFDEFIGARYRKNTETAQLDPGKLPEEYMESSFCVHRQSLVEEILERLRTGTWRFFEMVVNDIVVSLGYGSVQEEPRLHSGPGDEGIDGVIKQDELGLDILCLQAKKWEKPVGRPEIQKFAGSLDGVGARKGIFITSSRFTKEAVSYCEKIDKRIVLVDGCRLAELMVDHDVGVSEYKRYVLKRPDSDYFDQV